MRQNRPIVIFKLSLNTLQNTTSANWEAFLCMWNVPVKKLLYINTEWSSGNSLRWEWDEICKTNNKEMAGKSITFSLAIYFLSNQYLVI